MEKIAKESYPHVEVLKQVKGVGTQIGLTYVLTLDDPHRFPKSREVGCFSGCALGTDRALGGDADRAFRVQARQAQGHRGAGCGVTCRGSRSRSRSRNFSRKPKKTASSYWSDRGKRRALTSIRD